MNKRLETGTIQERNDWPGLFIRGDDALHYVLELKGIVRWLKQNKFNELEPLTFSYLEELLKDLSNVRQRENQKLQKVILLNPNDFSSFYREEILDFIISITDIFTLKDIQTCREKLFSFEIDSEQQMLLLNFKLLLLAEHETKIQNKIIKTKEEIESLKNKELLNPEIKTTISYWISENEKTINFLETGSR